MAKSCLLYILCSCCLVAVCVYSFVYTFCITSFKDLLNVPIEFCTPPFRSFIFSAPLSSSLSPFKSRLFPGNALKALLFDVHREKHNINIYTLYNSM